MKYLVSFTFLLLFLRAGAQDYVIDMKHWDVKDGLPYRQPNCICQDKQGFIWIGTRYGVSRFDGYVFTNYTHEKNGHPFSEVTDITEGPNGRFWIICRTKTGYSYFEFNGLTGALTPLENLVGKIPGEGIAKMVALPDGSILVNTFKENVYYSWYPGKGWERCVLPASYSVICDFLPVQNYFLVQDDQQEVLAVTRKGEIVKKVNAPFAKGSFAQRLSTENKYVNDNSTKKIYQLTPDLKITEVTGKLPGYISNNDDNIFDAGIDGIIWRQGRLYQQQKGILRDFNAEKIFVTDEHARALLPDDKGHIWMANDFGLNMFTIRRNKFRQYFKNASKTVYFNSSRAIQVWNGTLYAVNEFLGLYAYSPGVAEPRLLVRNTGYYSLKQTAAGLMFGKVNILRGNGKYEFYKDSSRNGDCWCIYPVDSVNYLIGTARGLQWFNSSSGKLAEFTQYNGFEELAGYTVLYVAKGRDGLIWICSNNGLYAYDAHKGITGRYSSEDKGMFYLPASEFQHFFEDQDGIFWLASTHGLIRWDKKRSHYKLFSQEDGLSNNNIYGVYGDSLGNLWMSSDYGIMKMNKATGAVRTYLEEDGITNNEFNRVAHFQDSSGAIYFGSLNGITGFSPGDFLTDTAGGRNSSPLVITSFFQFNGESNQLEDKKADLLRANTITMYPDDRFFTLEFALLNYDDPEHTTYCWKVDGLDTGWNIQKDRALRLSRLPYDLHRLHIKALAADGSWSRNELNILVNVIRPVYLRLWFMISCLIAAIALVLAGYRWRLYLLRKENERLDKVVREKTEGLRISLHQKEILLREIHHRVKNNLQVISSLLRLQSHNVKDEAAKNALLEGQNRVLSIALLHQKLYQNENLDRVEFSGFADELFAQLMGVISKPGLEISFNNGSPEVFLSIDIAVPLGLILNELITNSFKYAFNQVAHPVVKMTLEQHAGRYTLTYTDNGPGLAHEVSIEKSKSLGLRLVSRLSKQINGNVKYINKIFIVHFAETELNIKK